MNKFLTFYSKRAFPFIFFVFMAVYAFGHGYAMHDSEVCQMLFGKSYNYENFNSREKNKIEWLNNAAYLALDYYNSNSRGPKALRILQVANIDDLPQDLDEINYSSNGNKHQEFTHKGWNFYYQNDKGNWNKRKAILLNTAARVFGKTSYNSRIDAFCALIYYCHVLGDHEGDVQDSSATRMALGGIKGDYTILNELSKNVIPYLFNQKGAQLCKELLEINDKVDKLLSRKPGSDNRHRRVNELSSKEYLEYQKYATQTLRLLQKQVPVLLQKQSWFTDAFPSAKNL